MKSMSSVPESRQMAVKIKVDRGESILLTFLGRGFESPARFDGYIILGLSMFRLVEEPGEPAIETA
ncbi:hypothetical protein ES708_24743 [subsurface metagenome]